MDAPGFDDPVLLNNGMLVSFLYEESLDGCAKWAMNLVDKVSDRFNDFLALDGGTGFTFRFRFGVDGINPQNPVNFPITPYLKKLTNWKTLELLQGRKRTWGDLTVFNFKGLCHGNALNRCHPIDRNWERARVSDIVTELAEDAGLDADVEETVGQYTISNGKCSSGSFIKNYLLPLAYSRSGRKDWRFWVRDGDTVVFRPSNSTESPRLKFSDWVQDDPNIIIMAGPEAIKTVAQQVWDGSGRMRVNGHDPMSNRYQWHETYESNADFNYLARGRPFDREWGTATQSFSHFAENRNLWGKTTTEQLKHEAESRWARNARGLYKMVSEVPFSVGLTPGDKVRVVCQEWDDPDSSSGIWQLNKVRNICTQGELKAYVVLEKRWEGNG